MKRLSICMIEGLMMTEQRQRFGIIRIMTVQRQRIIRDSTKKESNLMFFHLFLISLQTEGPQVRY